MNIVTDNTGLIVMISDGYPTPPEGGHLHILTDAERAECDAAFAQPNGGVMFDGESFNALPAPPPPPPPPPTPEQKLAALGMTVDELKKLLGL
jgi:hypothetical protein